MSVSLSPIYNGYQSFLATGLPNSGGYLYTYAAGTSTPQATFTTSAGNIQNANPMQFNAGGYPPSAIWLTDGQAYKFVITDALGNNVQIFDNIEGSWTTGNLFAALNGSSSQPFAVASGTAASGAVPLSQAQAQFAAINGSASQTFSVAAAASGSTQAPQVAQTVGDGASSGAYPGKSLNTTYTNSTSRPLWVVARVNFNLTSAGQLFQVVTLVNGSAVSADYEYNYNYNNATALVIVRSVYILVPPGQTYEVNSSASGGGAVGLQAWYEY